MNSASATTKAPPAWRRIVRDPAVKQGVITFVVLRVLLTVWAIVVLTIVPIPDTADETLRPYLDQPVLSQGSAGLLLGPWQRFDALRYTRIAAVGYSEEANSVFPPLYPFIVRGLAFPLGGIHAAHLSSAILIANLACLALFILLHKVTAAELGSKQASRTVLYFALFPAAFFLMAPYTESLFLLLALASMWQGRRQRLGRAGWLGFFASLTRLTGWILAVPLAYEWWQAHLSDGRWQQPPWRSGRFWRDGVSVLLPGLGTLLFLTYRWAIGLPPLSQMYATYWFQRTGFPGADMVRALQTMLLDGPARAGEFTLGFDFFCVILIAVTTVLAWKRLPRSWALYALMLLLFILLPTSEVKPLYSFSRYTLAFFPTFMLLGKWGQTPWANRLILYPSVILYLYFSGQFFLWGWVA